MTPGGNEVSTSFDLDVLNILFVLFDDFNKRSYDMCMHEDITSSLDNHDGAVSGLESVTTARDKE